jgi:hypothetical protein
VVDLGKRYRIRKELAESHVTFCIDKRKRVLGGRVFVVAMRMAKLTATFDDIVLEHQLPLHTLAAHKTAFIHAFLFSCFLYC